MIPLYIAQMKEIEQTNPELHEEFKKGNWVVNRNDIPFCCIGADNALEHVNRQMKVSGGIIGITQNEAARSRFFLVSPELSKISEEAFKMCGQKSSVSEKHHEDNLPVTRRMEASAKSLLSVLCRCGNPFGEESTDVLNIITKEIMPNVIKTDILRVLQVGEELSQNFIEERIQSNMVNLWAPMKKAKLQLWRNNIKNSKLSIKEKACELKEDRGLFARILIAARSRPEINLQEIISSYELSAVPRSMFSTDGPLLPVSAKSQLLHILEELVSSTNVKGPASDLESSTVAQQEVSAALMPSDDPATTAKTSLFSDRQQRVAVIDAMSDVQCLSKPHWVKTCKDLGTHFVETMKRKYILPNQFDEVHFIFDRYDVALSLKTETRHKRLGNRVAVQYRIDDETNITYVPMKKLLSHSKTKDELSTYLARSLLNMSYNLDITVVCAWRTEAESNILDVSDLSICHEEADTKIILHSLHASRRGFSNLSIFSHDTDVLLLALRRYHLLPRESIFCTGTGIHHREIRLDRISDTLTTLQAKALPGFHALSGCDITGSFAGKGKRSFWKVFIKCDDDVLQTIARLGTEDLQTETKKLLEKFICMVYKPDTDESDIGKLRWDMFKQHQNESERLPPTKSALEEALKRANYQCLIWNSDEIALPAIPEPEGHGWVKKTNRYVPVMSSIPPAPEAAMNLVKCNCIKSNCSSKCRCRANGLTCTELCGCGSDDAKCTNTIIQSLFATHLTNENEPKVYAIRGKSKTEPFKTDGYTLNDGSHFFTMHYFPINNCWLKVSREESTIKKYKLELMAKNRAMLVKLVTTEIGDLALFDGIGKYQGMVNTSVLRTSSEGVTLGWNFVESCYIKMQIYLTFWDPKGREYERKVHPDATEFDITNLQSETAYNVSLIIEYDLGTSEEVVLSFQTGAPIVQAASQAGKIAGIIFGLLVLVLIGVIVFMGIMIRKGKFQKVNRLVVEPIQKSIRRRTDPGGVGYKQYNTGGFDEEDIYMYGAMTYDTTPDWQYRSRDLSFEEIVAIGKFARICKATIKVEGRKKTVVAKSLKDGFTEADVVLMKAKINFFGSKVGKHPCVLGFVGSVTDDEQMGPVMLLEYCESGPMKNWLTEHLRKGTVSDDVIERLFRFSYDIARGMQYLASKEIIHMRLAARNILLTGALEARIAGFGPRQGDDDDDEASKKERIPVKWIAPECFDSSKTASEKSDVWSYGVTVWEIFSMGNNPYNDIRSKDLPKWLKKGNRLPKPENSDDLHSDIMAECWEWDPARRPTFSDITSKMDSLYQESPDDMYYER